MTGPPFEPNVSPPPLLSVDLVDEPIDVPGLQVQMGHPDAGAVCWFLGVTRRTTGDKVTELLSYDAHRSMALSELRKLAEAAVGQFSLLGLTIVHRLGDVPVGEPSIVVGCCSPHRIASFQAVAWVMDRVKQDIPIWKRETYRDGKREWIHPSLGDESKDCSGLHRRGDDE